MSEWSINMDVYQPAATLSDIVFCMVDYVLVKLFADDAKIYTVIDNVKLNSGRLQHSLDLLLSWVDH